MKTLISHILVIALALIITGVNNNVMAQVVAGPDQTICDGDTTQLSATGGSNYYWTSQPFDPTISNRYIPDPYVSPDLDTRYVVESREVGGNLILNGNFEAGNNFFTSEYIYNPVSLWDEGTYAVVEDAGSVHPNFSCNHDHTTGTGKMMVVNGAGTPNVEVWGFTVNNIIPNTDYEFATWATSVVSSNPAILQFRINGELLAVPFNVSPQICSWDQFFEVWNSGTATAAVISIVNQNTASSGNDFALDDISFAPVTFYHDTTWVFVEPVPTSLFSIPDETCAFEIANIIYEGNAPAGASYHWEFDGGVIHSGSGQGPYEVYWENTGLPEVSLWIDGYGCTSDTTIQTIQINELPSVELTADETTIPYGTNTTLHGIISGNPGPVNYEWYPDTLLIDPFSLDTDTKLLEQTTLFTLTVNDETTGCINSEEITIAVTGGPLGILDLNAEPDVICLNESTVLHLTVTGGSGDYTATWTSDPPGFSYQGPEMELTVSPSDTINYIVEVTDGYNNVGPASVMVYVKPLPEVVTHPADVNIREGNDAVFTVESVNANQYQWEESQDNGSNWIALSDNTTYEGSNTLQLTIHDASFDMDGYLYHCIVSGDCEPAVYSGDALLTVRELLTVETTLEDDSYCMNFPVLIPVDLLNFTDIIEFQLEIAYDDNFLEFVGIQNLDVNIQGMDITTQPGIVLLNWSSVNPVSITGNKLLDFEFQGNLPGLTGINWNQANSYYIDSYQEFMPDSFTDCDIELLALPDNAGVISGPEKICVDYFEMEYSIDEVQHADLYHWTIPDEWTLISGEGTNTISVNPGGEDLIYRILVHGINECGTGDSSVFQISMIPDPEPPGQLSAYPDYLYSGDDQDIMLTVTGGEGDTLVWMIDACDEAQFLGYGDSLMLIQPEQTTTYFARWINACGMSECNSVTVFIDEETRILAPNAFTPDGDGLNDVFKLYSPNSFSTYKLYIYNRSGQVIFESDDIDHGWDGKIEGQDASVGTYVWILEYQLGTIGIEKAREKKKGLVTLVK